MPVEIHNFDRLQPTNQIVRRLLLFFLLFVSLSGRASHIVGGEFELLHIEDFRYKLNLILYFDVKNGNPGARDNDVTARIFRKSDNQPMMDVLLPFVQVLRVDYFQPQCSQGEIITDKLIYSAEITLPPDVYNDPAGYYIAWERCCRNYSITNIYSEDPQDDGAITAGQTFYLEFPPVMVDGKPFVNSSPQLFPPLNDYACPNRPYWVDFAGVDVDGDSLVYSLITPLNTVTAQAIPPGGPHPAPYPPITWRPGYGRNNIMNGAPDLAISNKGFLTVTPTRQGLYVFAVKCEEYRDGIKIGEVIRDFQMLVLAACPVADPPVVRGRKLGEADFTYVDNMTVSFANSVADSSRCIEIEVSDLDASKPEDNFEENIWLKAIPLDFDSDEQTLQDILPDISNAVLRNGSTSTFRICFDACPLVRGRPFTVGIVAFDDACALPLTDTLRIQVNIEPPANTPAYFTTGDVAVQIREGNDYTLPIQALDTDGDTLDITVLTDGFEPAAFGMTFDNEQLSPGSYQATFNWATGCDVYDFTQRTRFNLKVVVNDRDQCDVGVPDTLNLDLEVILPPNTDPVISSDLQQTDFLWRILNPLDFNVFGTDSDGDELELRVEPVDFALADYEIDFKGANGVNQVQAPFAWSPDCNNVDLSENGRRDFRFYFILNDLDKCKFPNYDTLQVDVKLLPPENTAPQISLVNNSPEINFSDTLISLQVGQQLQMEIVANDAELNNVVLQLLPDSRLPQGTSVADAIGAGKATTSYSWLAECRHLLADDNDGYYTLKLAAYDDACFAALGDTLALRLEVQDLQRDMDGFLPPNVFTPNGDGVNDTYSLPAMPPDNCAARFLSFRVMNRWGTEVFSTTDRDFVWQAKGLPAGVYFYVLAFSDREYNGQISILY